MRFASFLRVHPFLECQRFVNLAVRFIKKSDTTLFLRVHSFYIALFVGVVGRKKKIVSGEGGEGGEIDRSSITGKFCIFYLCYIVSI